MDSSLKNQTIELCIMYRACEVYVYVMVAFAFRFLGTGFLDV